jgi:ABC-type Fe3+/spermidine/putrescine transport system ATPase subunit
MCAVRDLVLRARATEIAQPGVDISVVIRPERVEISPSDNPDAGEEANVHPALVEQIAFLGAHTQVLVRVGDCILISQISNVQGELPDWVREGEKVSMRISVKAVQLLPPGPKPPESVA